MTQKKEYTWRPLVSLVSREVVRFYRQRSRVIGSLAAPLIFWFFLGSGLSAAFPTPAMPGGKGYLEYFFPGILLLTILFASIFANISVIEDRHEGFLQSVMVAPISRFALVGGKVFGGALISLMQGLLFLCLAPLAGFSLWGPGLLLALATLGLLSLTLTALGFVFAWKLDSVQGFHSIMNLVLFPMWLLSGAFFPAARAPVWLRPIMYLNPLTYGLAALQKALYLSNTAYPAEGGLLSALLISAAFGIVFYGVSIWAVNQLKVEVTV
jgi:ABC-2 type transport system permease protein